MNAAEALRLMWGKFAVAEQPALPGSPRFCDTAAGLEVAAVLAALDEPQEIEDTPTGALQAEIGAWHRQKYNGTPLIAIGNKLAEETGEVCRAIDRLHYSRSAGEDEHWALNLKDEIGDLGIVLLALCARGGLDFEVAVAERWEEVSTR